MAQDVGSRFCSAAEKPPNFVNICLRVVCNFLLGKGVLGQCCLRCVAHVRMNVTRMNVTSEQFFARHAMASVASVGGGRRKFEEKSQHTDDEKKTAKKSPKKSQQEEKSQRSRDTNAKNATKKTEKKKNGVQQRRRREKTKEWPTLEFNNATKNKEHEKKTNNQN